MAHKTLIGGTAYEIGGGKTLVSGTAYSIDKGKTLVGGTVYEVGFAPTVANVTLKVSSSSNSEAKGKDVYFEVRGDVRPFPTIPDYVVNPFKVDGSNDVTHALETQPGTIIYCKACPGGSITVNGVDIGETSYEYTVVGDVTLYMNVKYNYSNGTYANITITET